jgi:cell division protease FtsH
MYTKNILRQRLMVALGGKAAETIYYGKDNVSLGAYQDLKQANDLAKKMIQDYGFGEELEVYSKLPSESTFGSSSSEYTAAKIDQEIQMLVNSAYQNVTKLLEANYDKMEEIKTKLLTSETKYLTIQDL